MSSPNLHHRVYLRILVTLSCLAYVATLLSLAVTAHAASGKGVHEQHLQRRVAQPDAGYPVAPLATATDAQEETASDPEADGAER